MNYGFLRFLFGRLIFVTGLLFILPFVVGHIYHEKQTMIFAVGASVCIVVGWLIQMKPPKTREFYAREGFVATSLSWLIMSIIGAIPFVVSGDCPDFVDALFEIVSGLTTTGGSILTSVEGMSKCVQFWRCFSHWIGGMGVLVFILAILPMAEGYGMHLMRAESPGPTASKLVPRLASTAKILYLIYLFFSVMETMLLVISGMPVYDAFTVTFSTVGTGGFAVTNQGMGGYNAASQTIVTVFMILCSINFNFFYFIVAGQGLAALKMEEVRGYLIMVFGSAALVTIDLLHSGTISGVVEAFRHALFNVASITSTTGFATKDFNQWPEFSRAILMVLCLIGACAGSTGGGFKVSRVLILLKTAKSEMVHVTHRRSVLRVHFDGKSLEEKTVRSTAAYLILYVAIFLVSILIVSLNGFDLETTVTGVAATFNNVGPGLSMVGPAGNYSAFNHVSKIVFIFDMLAGRLEILPMLILFRPGTWKRNS